MIDLKKFSGFKRQRPSTVLALALDGITSFSPVPLRLIAGLGGLVCLFSLLMVLFVLGVRLFTDRALPGWASITVPIYLLGGVQLLCVGILGEYVGKTYAETKGRPRYLIEKLERHTSLRDALPAEGVKAAGHRVVTSMTA